ncbi:MAG: tRNA (adenosine(37)-N6)-dimethylallyltransferase MiaA [Lachnospiraceae bacterium]|nr:tRNA (adenosine(37)-N6)-dimethylallyltransferase MiaA [Lachnospiraceae bacterium]
MIQNKLVILTGPTAVGKTKLSISLAKTIGGEIISADSMQVYRHMDIGTAKITGQEMDGVPHHLIDVLEPEEEFDIVRFQTMAKQAIREIYERGHVPILVGGTGFYIQSVLYDIDFLVHEEESGLRKELEKQAETPEGAAALYERLLAIDPESAKKIHAHNLKRVIRAIEFYEENQAPISAHNEDQRKKESPYVFCYFVLNDDRGKLYARIDGRVEQMMAQGLLSEVRSLKEHGCTRDMISMQGLGYKELLDHLEGAISLDEAVYRIKRDTRHFAKRQVTWFKRERDVIWLNRGVFASEDAILSGMLEHLREKGILEETKTEE